MKNLILLITSIFALQSANAGRLQDVDFMSELELDNTGSSKAALLNDVKIYVTSVAKTLDQAIADGDIGSSSPTTTLGDIIFNGGGGDVRYGIGTDGQILTSDGSVPQWEDVPEIEGGVNFNTNGDFEKDLTGWTTYDDGFVTVPTTCVGSAASLITRNTTLPIRGLGDLKFAKNASNVQGEGFAQDFVIGNGYQSSMITTTLKHNSSGADVDDGDITYFIYDITNTKLIGDPAGYPILAGTTSHIFQWQASPDSVNYRICGHVVTDELNALDYFVDDVVSNEKAIAKAPVITDWIDFTPTGTWTTNTTYTGKYRRVGDSAEISYTVSLSGAPTVGALAINFPTGLNIDTNKVDYVAAVAAAYGSGEITDSSLGASHPVEAMPQSGQQRFLVRSTNAVTGQSNVTNIVPFTFAAGDSVTFKASIPIQGWSSNAQTSEDLGGREIVVEGAGNGGTILTANVTPIDFIQTKDTTSAWNGSQFTATETGDYTLDGLVNMVSASPNIQIKAYVGETFIKAVGLVNASDTNCVISGVISLLKGEVLTLRSATANTLLNSTTLHHIYISKKASPQTILPTELVAARYTSNSGQIIGTAVTILVYEDLVKDTHNAYNISTGVYTIPVSGWYDIKSKYRVTATSAIHFIYIYIDGVVLDREFLLNSSFPTTKSIQTHIYLSRGQEVTILGSDNSSNKTMDSTSVYNVFSIARVK